ncbi:hypothetical protein EK21DRAFT_94325 [Setomelanomma holmii]|uniref:RING-type domain-containing protein n=1 Tax=Setomelanomma holmii TaxID=210430 RepID=A0A9P4LGF2_9PLEO|nr:hypothetical protein EK21DRAFT_94325 [Setomelanomma holmii]
MWPFQFEFNDDRENPPQARPARQRQSEQQPQAERRRRPVRQRSLELLREPELPREQDRSHEGQTAAGISRSSSLVVEGQREAHFEGQPDVMPEERPRTFAEALRAQPMHIGATAFASEALFLRIGLRTMGAVFTLPHYNCPLCREKLRARSDAVEIVACSHAFHRGCFFDWIHSDDPYHSCCPSCRLRLFQPRDPRSATATRNGPTPDGIMTPRTVLSGHRGPADSEFANPLAERLDDLDIDEEATGDTEPVEEGEVRLRNLPATGDIPGVGFNPQAEVVQLSPHKTHARSRRSEEAEET